MNSTTASGADIDPSARLITIDSEHFLIRLLLPVLTLGAILLTHIGGLYVLDSVLAGTIHPLCLVLPADLAVLLAGSTVFERLLKALFPSRRFATLSDTALVVTDTRGKSPVVTRITWDTPVNVNAWLFAVPRRGRVPRGWYCMALHMLQHERAVILYTFMSSTDAEAVAGFNRFVRLRPRTETQSNSDLNTVAEQRRLLKLEDARWQDGAEVSQEDFIALLGALQQHVSEWR